MPSCMGLGLEGLDTERVRSAAVLRAGVRASSVSCGEMRDEMDIVRVVWRALELVVVRE